MPGAGRTEECIWLLDRYGVSLGVMEGDGGRDGEREGGREGEGRRKGERGEPGMHVY